MPAAPTPVRPVTDADVPTIARSLARAFVDDPVFRFMLGGHDLRLDRGIRFFSTFARIQLPRGRVSMTEGGEAAAIWAPPGHWKVGTFEVMKATPGASRT